MLSYGIGYGQIEDFKKFLSDLNIGDFEMLSESQKQEVTRNFNDPKAPTLGVAKTKMKTTDPIEPKKKPDILSYYDSDIRPKFKVEELLETSHYEVYLTTAAKQGWLLEVKTTMGMISFPFLTQESCEKVIGFIWKDWHPYGLKKYEDKEKENEQRVKSHAKT